MAEAADGTEDVEDQSAPAPQADNDTGAASDSEGEDEASLAGSLAPAAGTGDLSTEEMPALTQDDLETAEFAAMPETEGAEASPTDEPDVGAEPDDDAKKNDD